MKIDERDRALLEQRARALARPRTSARGVRTEAGATPHDLEARGSAARSSESSEPTPFFAVFARAGVHYAIHPRFVFEVARVLAPTPLPLAAAHWLGVSSLHGELLALADLALLFGHGAPPALRESVGYDASAAERRSSLVLVLGSERRELGLLIDQVLEARPLLDALTRVPAGDPASQLLLGTSEENVRVLRGEALLSDPRLSIQATHSSEV